jgi:hypothetical protein
MLSNKKGTVLVIAVAAMMIMGIIGFICLQVYTNQSILDSYDQIRKRTFYSAEGAVEMMKGYIDKKLNENEPLINNAVGDTYLYDKTKNKNWAPFTNSFDDYAIFKTVYGKKFHNEDGKLFLKSDQFFDRTIHPGIKVIVFVHRVKYNPFLFLLDDYTLYREVEKSWPWWPADPMSNYTGTNKHKGLYVIVASAFADHKSTMGVNTVRTTLRLYFCTHLNGGDMSKRLVTKWVAWRVD